MHTRAIALLFVVAAATLSFACGGGSSSSADPNGSDTSEQSSTGTAAPLTCIDGQVHARACTGPDVEDVSNDLTSPCPAGMTPDAAESAAICCDPASATESTACYRLPLDCGADCATVTQYGFSPTDCDDATWSADHPDACTDAALDAWDSSHPSPYGT